jgi:diaminohydroxyphosphoribosylaminopyrimidine deaminase/5-amino-6-(5-phosphoribosylamino)uracil reductase
VDAILAAGIAKVVVGAKDPLRDGIARLRDGAVEVELADLWEARVQNEAWLTWARLRRPFVTYKAAMTLDARLTVPGRRWVSGEESRRVVHELRAASDAVAVGMGTVRADNPHLDAREVAVQRQPRRLAFGRGPLPDGSELELLSGTLEEELRRLAEQNVQSLLLEGGPTLASSFFAGGLVDKIMLFVAPTIAGAGPAVVTSLDEAVSLTRSSARPVGEDVLLTAYVHEP